MVSNEIDKCNSYYNYLFLENGPVYIGNKNDLYKLLLNANDIYKNENYSDLNNIDVLFKFWSPDINMTNCFTRETFESTQQTLNNFDQIIKHIDTY